MSTTTNALVSPALPRSRLGSGASLASNTSRPLQHKHGMPTTEILHPPRQKLAAQPLAPPLRRHSVVFPLPAVSMVLPEGFRGRANTTPQRPDVLGAPSAPHSSAQSPTPGQGLHPHPSPHHAAQHAAAKSPKSPLENVSVSIGTNNGRLCVMLAWDATVHHFSLQELLHPKLYARLIEPPLTPECKDKGETAAQPQQLLQKAIDERKTPTVLEEEPDSEGSAAAGGVEVVQPRDQQRIQVAVQDAEPSAKQPATLMVVAAVAAAAAGGAAIGGGAERAETAAEKHSELRYDENSSGSSNIYMDMSQLSGMSNAASQAATSCTTPTPASHTTNIDDIYEHLQLTQAQHQRLKEEAARNRQLAAKTTATTTVTPAPPPPPVPPRQRLSASPNPPAMTGAAHENDHATYLSPVSIKPPSPSPAAMTTVLAASPTPSTPPRNVIDEAAKRCSWYQLHRTTEAALAVLANQQEGTFIVRASKVNFASLSYIHGSQLRSLHIVRVPGGLKLKGSETVCDTLGALVQHLLTAGDPELLCKLCVPRAAAAAPAAVTLATDV